MNTKIVTGVVVVLALAVAAYYWWPGLAQAPFMQTTQEEAANQTFGTYAYECDEHVAFALTPSADLSSVQVVAIGGGAYPPPSTLLKKDAASGARYEGNGVVLAAQGETVTLGEGDSAINCSPVADTNNAPMNWGY